MKPCSICGTTLEVRKEDTIWYCPTCKREFFANPVPVCDTALFDAEGRVLLGVRARDPYKGKLNLPGGFVDMHETLEAAAERELGEELGLKPSDHSALHYVSNHIVWHMQYGERRQLIAIVWAATMPHRDFPPNEEVAEYVWRWPSELQPHELTTTGEYEVIQKAAKIFAALPDQAGRS